MTLDTIDSFSGDHEFLSNFHPSRVQLGGVTGATVEHAFQAAKATKIIDRLHILAQSTPGRAKRAGRKVELRPDWEDIKLWVMEDLVRQKFRGSPLLRMKLLGTGDATLIEGNNWGDTFWGTVNGKGSNHLGKLLMQVRAEIREADWVTSEFRP